MFQRSLQLQAAAADIFEIFAKQPDRALRGDLRARFLEFLIVHQHFARKNQRLRALARGGQATIHQKFVESDFQKYLAREFYHESASTRFSAKC